MFRKVKLEKTITVAATVEVPKDVYIEQFAGKFEGWLRSNGWLGTGITVNVNLAKQETATQFTLGTACSFCGKKLAQSEQMVGKDGFYLCKECIDRCGKIMADQSEPSYCLPDPGKAV